MTSKRWVGCAKVPICGLVPAQFDLGVAYAKGAGVEKNLLLACFWLSLAGSQPKQPEAARDKVCHQLDAKLQLAVMIQIVEAQSALKKCQAASRQP